MRMSTPLLSRQTPRSDSPSSPPSGVANFFAKKKNARSSPLPAPVKTEPDPAETERLIAAKQERQQVEARARAESKARMDDLDRAAHERASQRAISPTRFSPSLRKAKTAPSSSSSLVGATGEDEKDERACKPLCTQRHDDAVVALAFSPRGDLLATGGGSAKARSDTSGRLSPYALGSRGLSMASSSNSGSLAPSDEPQLQVNRQLRLWRATYGSDEVSEVMHPEYPDQGVFYPGIGHRGQPYDPNACPAPHAAGRARPARQGPRAHHEALWRRVACSQTSLTCL